MMSGKQAPDFGGCKNPPLPDLKPGQEFFEWIAKTVHTDWQDYALNQGIQLWLLAGTLPDVPAGTLLDVVQKKATLRLDEERRMVEIKPIEPEGDTAQEPK